MQLKMIQNPLGWSPCEDVSFFVRIKYPIMVFYAFGSDVD